MYFSETHEYAKLKAVSNYKILKRFIPIILNFKFEVVLSSLLLVLTSAMSLLPSLYLKYIVDSALPSKSYKELTVLILVFLITEILHQLLNYKMMIGLEVLGVKIISDIKKRLFNSLLNGDVSYFDKNGTGKLMSRVENDTETIRKLFSATLFTLFGSMLSLIGMCFVMAKINLKLFAVLIVLVIPIAILLEVFQKKIQPMFVGVRKAVAEIIGFITEMVQGMKVVQAFSREEYVIAKMEELNQKKIKKEILPDIIAMSFEGLSSIFEIIGLTLVIYVGGTLIDSKELTIGALVLFLTYLRQFFAPIHAFAEQMGTFQRAAAASTRIFGILDMKTKIKTHSQIESDWIKFKSSIEFKDLWFAYPFRDADKTIYTESEIKSWTIKNINFKINKGEKVAIVGATGGGKSTIINLIMRFYEFQRGNIEIDGIDIRKIPIDVLRNNISLVLQDVVLFPDSIKDNITLGKKELESNLENVVNLLDLNKVLKNQKDGINTVISEKGANLSQGERQIISFARAIINNPEILVLDEATSSIDPYSERIIQEGLSKILKGRTSIVIAHRLSTILDADKIIVIKNGELIEIGNHTSLLEKDGYYAKLYKTQFSN